MLENSRLSILFFTRKHEKENDALKIYARATIDAKRTEFSLNRDLKANLWDKNFTTIIAPILTCDDNIAPTGRFG